jgi:hypothetical protein
VRFLEEAGEIIYHPDSKNFEDSESVSHALVVLHPVWLSKLFNTIISPQNSENSIGIMDIDHLKARLWIGVDPAVHEQLLNVIIAFGVCEGWDGREMRQEEGEEENETRDGRR